jgi:hypothetical protein
MLVDQVLQARTLAVLTAFATLSGLTLVLARGAASYGPNLALNLAAEFIGGFVILFALTPILRRAQQGGVREHRRLDFQWYIDRVVTARTSVRVLDTYSRLCSPPFKDRFLQAALELLQRQGRVQVLLMDPDSRAAAQRTAELAGHGDVGRNTRDNLRVLNEFRDKLDEPQRSRFEARLYNSSQSVQINQWDDRLLASFFPTGGGSDDSAQLEVSIDSPLGSFVSKQFEELWQHARPIDDYMSLQLRVDDGNGGVREFRPRFVIVKDDYYVVDQEMIVLIALNRGRSLRAVLVGPPERNFLVEVVENHTAADARALFQEKYDQSNTAFIRLRLVQTQGNGVPAGSVEGNVGSGGYAAD